MYSLKDVFLEKYVTESPIERILGNELKYNKIDYRTQVEIGKYRVDILIGNLVIECDGAEYHKEPNIDRDIYLKNRGYIVKHYTGSHIFSDPSSILKDIKEYMYLVDKRRV